MHVLLPPNWGLVVAVVRLVLASVRCILVVARVMPFFVGVAAMVPFLLITFFGVAVLVV